MITPDIERELKGVLGQKDVPVDRIRVLLNLREKYQLSLQDAWTAIREFEQKEGLSYADTGRLHADIFAIGQFRKDLVDVLDYRPEYYKGVPERTQIINHVFELFNHQERWIAIGHAFGITDPLDFNQHQIDVTKFDDAKLTDALSSLGYESDEIAKEQHRVRRLIDTGFQFQFCLTER